MLPGIRPVNTFRCCIGTTFVKLNRKKVNMKITALLILYIVVCFSCNNNGGSNKAGTDTSIITKTITENAALNDIDQQKDIYGLAVNGNIIHLREWDSAINLDQILGTPLKKKTKQLDLNSDTFAGSFIKDLEYPGIKLKLFSPPQNGRTFWIQEIILTDKKHKTINGIRLGDALESVKQAYPSLKKFPGNSENMYWVANEGYEKSIEMEFEKDKLVTLRMYYMMN